MKLSYDDRQRLLESLETVLDKIRKCSEAGAYIIVEGRNDTKALNALNISKHIIQIYVSHHALIHLESRIPARSQVLILTDFDEEGKELAKRLKTVLVSRNPRFLFSLRQQLRKTVGAWVRTIESLPRFYQRLRRLQASHKHTLSKL